MYTVKELIEMLKGFPQGMKVQLDLDGAIYNDMHLDRVGKDRVVIFSNGEPEF